MPLYEYECLECGHLTEVLQRMSDPPLAECPQCGSAVRKVLSAPAFQFKGTGWYVTDYADKGKGGKKDEKAPKESGSSGDSKPAGKDKSAKPAAGSPSD